MLRSPVCVIVEPRLGIINYDAPQFEGTVPGLLSYRVYWVI